MFPKLHVQCHEGCVLFSNLKIARGLLEAHLGLGPTQSNHTTTILDALKPSFGPEFRVGNLCT